MAKLRVAQEKIPGAASNHTAKNRSPQIRCKPIKLIDKIMRF